MAIDGLSCFKCLSLLKNAWRDAANQPSEGTCFITYGHYGSTAFDPMDGTYIEINICDPCLREGSENSLVAMGQSSQPVVLSDRSRIGSHKIQREIVEWDHSKSYTDLDDVYVIGDIEDFELALSYGSRFSWNLETDQIREIILQLEQEDDSA